MKQLTPVNTKQCEHCGGVIFNIYRRSEWERKRFCSLECRHLADRGKPTWNKGRTGYMSEKGRKNISESITQRLYKWTPEQRERRHKKTVETRKRMGSYKGRPGIIGELHESWLGDKANYNSKHKWIQKHWIKTGTCQECKKETKPFGNRRWGTEWHNKTKDYNREERSSWVELCIRCHRRADSNY